MRIILTLSIAGLFAASAVAQYPGGYLPGAPGGFPGGFGGGYGGGFGGGYGGVGNSGIPGLYGGGLSPYLNLRSRNMSPAVNYFNFTRPYTGGTYGNAFVSPYLGGGLPGAPAGSRFFPSQIPVYADDEPERQKLGEADKEGFRKVNMPPAGHGGGFMNTMGHFGSASGLPGGGMRPAASLGRPRGR